MTRTVRRRRIEVLVDAPLARLVEAAAERAGVTNWALVPTLAGLDGGQHWRDDRLTEADRRMIFLTVLSPEKADALVDALAPMLDTHGLALLVSDVEVLRPERY